MTLNSSSRSKDYW